MNNMQMHTRNGGGFARIRSIREVARYCKQMDPDTQLTEYTLRKLIADGTIPSVKSGSKFLINLDTILEMFGVGGEIQS